jgi:hypothetical protein
MPPVFDFGTEGADTIASCVAEGVRPGTAMVTESDHSSRSLRRSTLFFGGLNHAVPAGYVGQILNFRVGFITLRWEYQARSTSSALVFSA